MFNKVTQENLSILIPSKSANIARALSRDRRMSIKAALLTFYHSQAYTLLEREQTKLWHNSAAQIYAEYFPQQTPKKTYQHGPGHSKLTPYREQIRLWQKQGITLRQMAELLAKRGCITTPQNIWKSLRSKKISV